MNENQILSQIHSPDDVKQLEENRLGELATEIRKVLVETVSQTGGHLASNLGVVELTIALHRVFDSPRDQIVFDVGHQAYTHKLLTGRYSQFSTLRTENGLSGFERPNESEHDVFYSGHSSTSISSAYGLSAAKKLAKDDHYVIAVIGDGALTGGLAYEGLNNAGRTHSRLIVILNDNEMSISHNVGSMARYLAVIRSKPGYFRLKARIEGFLNHIPLVGKKISNLVFRSKSVLKNLIYQSTIFEDMGFQYMGPIDGHNLEQLQEALEGAKMLHRPVLLHINTVKGKGYDFAEREPNKFHGISKFDINTGEPVFSSTSFSEMFGRALCDFAQKDERICAITAAMALGTGLDAFSKAFPDRFFDVGIAEEHAVTFASGLAKNHMLPVFAVYSTFLQRCYDQLIHDASLQGNKMVLAIDRAGFVGEDGETHQGLFDMALLNSVPDLTIYSPSTFSELKNDLGNAFYIDKGIVAVRYPRGIEREFPADYTPSFDSFTHYGEAWAKIVIVTFGRLFSNACMALATLREKGISARIIKLNRIKPIDIRAVQSARLGEQIFFFEEGVRTGGIGEHFAALLLEKGFQGSFHLTAVEDCFVRQAAVPSLMAQYHMDADGMVQVILREAAEHGKTTA